VVATTPPAEPKPEPPKPVEQPKPEPPKPVEQPKPEPPKPVVEPKPEPPKPIDTSAFDGLLAAKDWAAAKTAADALPEPARTDANGRLTRSANAHLVATMKAARPLFDEGRFAESAQMLAKEMAAVPIAEPKIREAFVNLAKSVRQAAKQAEENQ
jgi:hypothetical protein